MLKESNNKITFPILMDTMDDKANMTYGAMPERLYIIQEERIVYCGKPGPSGYFVEEVEAWLAKYEGI